MWPLSRDALKRARPNPPDSAAPAQPFQPRPKRYERDIGPFSSWYRAGPGDRVRSYIVVNDKENIVSSTKTPALDDVKAHVTLKISALWASVMFLYIYADFFGLYVPGQLQGMQAGQMAPLGPATQALLLGTSLMMAIPSVMIFLSLALNPNLSRWLNIIFGVVYTVIILLTMWTWAFYIFYGLLEVTLTGLIAWYAWTWPKKVGI